MDIYSDLELSRRLERLEGEAAARFVEARARVRPDAGACWIERAGTYALFDGIDSPITQTFGLGVFEPVTPEDLEALEEFFEARGSATFHEVSPFAGVETYALLTSRGYRPVELTSVLYRPAVIPVTGNINPRVKVRAVMPDEYSLWARVSAEAWASELPGLEEFLLDLGVVSAAREDGVSYLAELDGVPVASGAMSLGSPAASGRRMALLAGAATIPEARRNGAQLALLDARLRHASASGCDLVMMCAAPGSSSQRNAERQGFRIAYTRVKWCRDRE